MSVKTRRALGSAVAGAASLAMLVSMAPGASALPNQPMDDDPNFVPSIQMPGTYRFAGSDRIATAIKAAQSKQDWVGPDGCEVVIARDDDFSDALAAAPFADGANAPILVNPTESLDPRVAVEINELKNQPACQGNLLVDILGGTGAISENTQAQIEGIVGAQNVYRMRGANRYQTAVVIAKKTVQWYTDHGVKDMNVFLTTGDKFPDALSAGSAASEDNGIVLLTKGDQMDTDYTQPYLNKLRKTVNDRPNVAEIVAVGGPSATAWPDADKKYVGIDRYETASKVADAYFQFTPQQGSDNNVAVASGLTWADAVVAAGYIANADGPLLLTKPNHLNAYTKAYLQSQRDWVDHAFVFGGSATLSPTIAAEVAAAISN